MNSDYNYERQNDGTCALVPGLSKPNHKEECAKDKTLIEWFEPTGYRRIPITTCQGGKELDKGESHACEGKEALWRGKQGGMGAFGIFFLTIVCLGMAGAIGWIIWNRWSGKFGYVLAFFSFLLLLLFFFFLFFFPSYQTRISN